MNQLVSQIASALFIATSAWTPAATQASEEFCGLGPPPGSRSFDNYHTRRNAQVSAHGYVLVCDRDLDRYRFDRSVESLDKALSKVRFNVTKIDATPFSAMKPLGAITDHFYNGKASSLRRVYAEWATNRIVTAFEWDMEGSGGSMRWLSTVGKTAVLGMEAREVNLKTRSGQSYTAINWVQSGRQMEVSVYSNRPLGTESNATAVTEIAQSFARAASR